MASGNAEDALWAVHSRLGAIEGKVNLIVRSEREQLLGMLEKAVKKDPLLGQIYLLLDGERTQQEVHALLGTWGIEASQPTVSRRIAAMETEHGIAVLAQVGNTKAHRRDAEMEKMLNLSKKVQAWLMSEGVVVPVKPTRTTKRRNEP
jgi:hypothetical protein